MIESPFRLLVEGAAHGLDPDDRSGLGPLLGIYPDRLAEAGQTTPASLRDTYPRPPAAEAGGIVAVGPFMPLRSSALDPQSGTTPELLSSAMVASVSG